MVVCMQAKLQVLKHDEGFLQSNLKYLRELGSRITSFAAESKESLHVKREAHSKELARRKQVAQLRHTLQDQQILNGERAANKASIDEEVVSHRVSPSYLWKALQRGTCISKCFTEPHGSCEFGLGHQLWKAEHTKESLSKSLAYDELLNGNPGRKCRRPVENQ